MDYRHIRWLAVVGSLVLTEVVLIGATFAWVAIYSHAVNPGQPLAAYQAHAQVAGPWMSIVIGVPVFFALGRWLLVNRPSAWALYGLYVALDIAVLAAMSSQTMPLPWLLVALSYLTKLGALALGVKMAGASRPLAG